MYKIKEQISNHAVCKNCGCGFLLGEPVPITVIDGLYRWFEFEPTFCPGCGRKIAQLRSYGDGKACEVMVEGMDGVEPL